jgi:hypothetical protein
MGAGMREKSRLLSWLSSERGVRVLTIVSVLAVLLAFVAVVLLVTVR